VANCRRGYRDIQSGGRGAGRVRLSPCSLPAIFFLSPTDRFIARSRKRCWPSKLSANLPKNKSSAVCQSDFSWTRRIWFRSCVGILFRKAGKAAHARRSGFAAGLPKAPGLYSPDQPPWIAQYAAAISYQQHVGGWQNLARQAVRPRNEPIVLHLHQDPNSLAPYFVEEIRRYLENKYGSDQVHEGGLRVYTSLDMDLQARGESGGARGSGAYERRRGWKGHLQNVLAGNETLDYQHSTGTKSLRSTLHPCVSSGSCARVGGISSFGRYSGNLTQADAGVDPTQASGHI